MGRGIPGGQFLSLFVSLCYRNTKNLIFVRVTYPRLMDVFLLRRQNVSLKETSMITLCCLYYRLWIVFPQLQDRIAVG